MDPKANTANAIHTVKGIASRGCLSFITSSNPANVPKPDVGEESKCREVAGLPPQAPVPPILTARTG